MPGLTHDQIISRGLDENNLPSGFYRVDGGSSSGFSSNLGRQLEEVKKYTEELMNEARGDYDFVTKYLSKMHQMALGTDDSARAQFLEQVSNELEKRVGRIPFDFQQKTEREKRDIADILRKNEVEAQDLAAQEAEFNAQQKLSQEKEQRGIAESANVRGLVGSGIEKKAQQEAATARQVNEIDPFNRRMALQRFMQEFGTERAKLESGRRLEDITTGARRDALDTQVGYDKGKEGAQRDLEKRLAEARRIGAAEERNVRSLLQQQEELSRLYG